MAGKAWVWLAAGVCLSAGCGGKASDHSAGPTGSARRGASDESSNDSSPAVTEHAGMPGAAGSAGGSVGAGAPSEAGSSGARPSAGDAGARNTEQDAREPMACVGTVEQAADALDFNCPMEFCVAKVMASDYGALPAGTLKTSATGCSPGLAVRSISFELSAINPPTARRAPVSTA